MKKFVEKLVKKVRKGVALACASVGDAQVFSRGFFFAGVFRGVFRSVFRGVFRGVFRDVFRGVFHGALLLSGSRGHCVSDPQLL